MGSRCSRPTCSAGTFFRPLPVIVALMSEVLKSPGFYYENLGNAIDFSFGSQDGFKLRLVGVSNDGTETLIGSQPKEIRVVLNPGGKSEESYELSRYVPNSLEVNAGWCKRLVLALGRQAYQWLGQYDFVAVLGFACDLHSSAPKDIGSGVTLEEEKRWVEEIVSGIDNSDYNYVWDFENKRQDGRGFFEEWYENTKELRR